MQMHRFAQSVDLNPGLPGDPYGYRVRPWMTAAARLTVDHLRPCAGVLPGHLVAVALVKDAQGPGFIAAHDQVCDADSWFVPALYEKLPPLEESLVDTGIVDKTQALCEEALRTYEAFRAKAQADRNERHRMRTLGAPGASLDAQAKRDSMALAQLKAKVRGAKEAHAQAKALLQREVARAQRAAWERRLATVSLFNGQETLTLAEILHEELASEHLVKAMLKTGLPALLAHARESSLEVLDWATFWWGESPENDLRHEGVFYHFPKLRHETLVRFLLQGRTLAPNVWAEDAFAGFTPEVLYEDDEVICLDKPAGMLCVPGKFPVANLFDTLKAMRPELEGPVLLHRLDMRTSGVVLFAKNRASHAALARDFETHRIEKTYEAVLESMPRKTEGIISLPLCQNPYDTPRQMVDAAYGRESVTRFRVFEKDGAPRALLVPVTGRTHQLRIHAAHARGLDAPIVGDELYGHPGERLMLHASAVTFTHPATGKELCVRSPCPF